MPVKTKKRAAKKAAAKQTAPRYSKHRQIMTGEGLSLSLVALEAKYSDVSAFCFSDRRTGHRWIKEGPPNTLSRGVQLLRTLGLTLQDAEFLINLGLEVAGDESLPQPVLNLKSQVATLRAVHEARRDRNRNGPKSRKAPQGSKAAVPA